MDARLSAVLTIAITLSTVSVSAAQPKADLILSKTGPAAILAGVPVTYTITVRNAGPDAADSVSLSDALNAESFVSVNQTAGPLFSIHAPSVGQSGPLTCDIATFANGASASFLVVVTPLANLPDGSTLTNTANVSAITVEPAPIDNQASSSGVISTLADIQIVNTTAAQVSAGGALSSTITVTNSGPSDAQSVSFTDPLPASLRFASIAQTGGPSFSCTTPAPASSGTVSCSIATLASGATASFQLHVTVDPSTPIGTSIVNIASASAATTDPAAGNNTATATSVVNAQIPMLSPATLALLAFALVLSAIVSIAR
jgi:uncharacterized repeat protein (TIGR01451 family)